MAFQFGWLWPGRFLYRKHGCCHVVEFFFYFQLRVCFFQHLPNLCNIGWTILLSASWWKSPSMQDRPCISGCHTQSCLTLAACKGCLSSLAMALWGLFVKSYGFLPTCFLSQSQSQQNLWTPMGETEMVGVIFQIPQEIDRPKFKTLGCQTLSCKPFQCGWQNCSLDLWPCRCAGCRLWPGSDEETAVHAFLQAWRNIKRRPPTESHEAISGKLYTVSMYAHRYRGVEAAFFQACFPQPWVIFFQSLPKLCEFVKSCRTKRCGKTKWQGTVVSGCSSLACKVDTGIVSTGLSFKPPYFDFLSFLASNFSKSLWRLLVCSPKAPNREKPIQPSLGGWDHLL